MENQPTVNEVSAQEEPKVSQETSGFSTDEIIDRLQSKVQQYVREADQAMLEHMRLTVFEVVVGVLRSKDFRGDIPRAVETACKAAKPLLKEISMQKPAPEELYEDAAEMDVSTPRSTSLMNQAAEGMRALGSFFAQAAMGGAEVSTLVREEEEAYHAEDILYPLRRLAANEPDLDLSLVRQSSMYAGSSLSGLSPGASLELPDSAVGATSAPEGDPAAPATKGGDPSLMGDHTGPTQEGADFAQGAQDRAKVAREAQQRQLADKTGDTLYPASDAKEDDGKDGGSFASMTPEPAGDSANTDHITGQKGASHLQEENWDAPARQAGAAAPAGEPADVKGSRGHGDVQVPHED